MPAQMDGHMRLTSPKSLFDRADASVSNVDTVVRLAAKRGRALAVSARQRAYDCPQPASGRTARFARLLARRHGKSVVMLLSDSACICCEAEDCRHHCCRWPPSQSTAEHTATAPCLVYM